MQGCTLRSPLQAGHFCQRSVGKVYRPLYHALDNIRRAKTPQNLYSALAKFHNEVKKTWLALWHTPEPGVQRCLQRCRCVLYAEEPDPISRICVPNRPNRQSLYGKPLWVYE